MERKAKTFLKKWFPKSFFRKKNFPDRKTGISVDYVNEKNNIFAWVTGGEKSYQREDGTTQRPQTPKNLENKLGELLFVLRKGKELSKTIIFFYNLEDQAHYTRDFISIFWDVAFDLNNEKIIEPDKPKAVLAKSLLQREIKDLRKPYFVTKKVKDIPAIKGSSKLARSSSDIPVVNRIWKNRNISQLTKTKNIDLDLLEQSIEDNIEWLKSKGIGNSIVEPYEAGDFDKLISNLAVPKLKHLFAPEEWYLGKSIEGFLQDLQEKNVPDLIFEVNYGGDYRLPNILTKKDSPLFIGGPGTDEDVVVELTKNEKKSVIGIQVRIQSSEAAGKKNYLNDCRRLASRNFLLKWDISSHPEKKYIISKSNTIYFAVLDGFWAGPKYNPRKGLDILKNSSCPDGVFFFGQIPILLNTIKDICLNL